MLHLLLKARSLEAERRMHLLRPVPQMMKMKKTMIST